MPTFIIKSQIIVIFQQVIILIVTNLLMLCHVQIILIQVGSGII